MKNSYPGPQVHWTRLANINIWVKLRSRNSEVFKIFNKYLSFLVYNQVYNLFFCTFTVSLFGFICEMKLRQTTAKFQLARHDTCHVKELLRYVNMTYSDYFWFMWNKKTAISSLHVIGMPLNEQFQFFSHAVLSSQTSRIPNETLPKILRPKINPPPLKANF